MVRVQYRGWMRFRATTVGNARIFVKVAKFQNGKLVTEAVSHRTVWTHGSCGSSGSSVVVRVHQCGVVRRCRDCLEERPHSGPEVCCKTGLTISYVWFKGQSAMCPDWSTPPTVESALRLLLAPANFDVGDFGTHVPNCRERKFARGVDHFKVRQNIDLPGLSSATSACLASTELIRGKFRQLAVRRASTALTCCSMDIRPGPKAAMYYGVRIAVLSCRPRVWAN